MLVSHKSSVTAEGLRDLIKAAAEDHSSNNIQRETIESLGVASGVVTPLTAAIQSSKSLYETIQTFRAQGRKIRDLRNELEGLFQVLESLKDVVDKDDRILSLLMLPVLHCTQACREFEIILVKCSKHSGGSRTSFRDWTKIKYMGGDIDDFKNVLAGYKSTLTIALCSLNLYASNCLAFHRGILLILRQGILHSHSTSL